jgi:hypothetical protein
MLRYFPVHSLGAVGLKDRACRILPTALDYWYELDHSRNYFRVAGDDAPGKADTFHLAAVTISGPKWAMVSQDRERKSGVGFHGTQR